MNLKEMRPIAEKLFADIRELTCYWRRGWNDGRHSPDAGNLQ